MRAQPLLAAPADPAVTRLYDRVHTWIYGPRVSEPSSGLIPIYWGDLPLNSGDTEAGLMSVVENVEGWLDSPPLDGHDAARAVADGSAWGLKTLGSRVITLTGAAAGPRDQLGAMRDLLSAQACSREPIDLTITNSTGQDRTLTASVRGDTDSLRWAPLGLYAFRWSVVLTAADPALYEDDWQEVALAPGAGGSTGRTYQRLPPWAYAGTSTPTQAMLTNNGNWPAPVFMLYDGDFASGSVVTDDAQSGQVNLAALAVGEQVLVESDTLSAVAAGGLSRASYILAGSTPLVLPPMSEGQWHLYAISPSGSGQVTLGWRSAWV